MNELSIRHREILRLAFSGMRISAIASQMGLKPSAISAVINSELGQAQLAKLTERADEAVTNTPMKVRLINELTVASIDSVRIAHNMLRDEKLDPRVRAGIGRHFMDRVIFNKDEDAQEGGYREILRSLDRLEKKADSIPTAAEIILNDSETDGRSTSSLSDPSSLSEPT
jgi:predicted transcriptional regulator